MHVSPLLSTCAQLDSDPLGCTTCEETEEDHDAVNMTVSENPEPNDLVNIEDVSRKTTIGEILNIVTKRIHYLGFPKMDLNMGLLQLPHNGLLQKMVTYQHLYLRMSCHIRCLPRPV